MSQIATILILAITVEALIEYAKLIVVNKAIVWKQIAALLMGVGLSVLAGTDLFAAIGVTFAVPYVGIILTGIIFSRGSNYVSDFIKKIEVSNNDREAD